MIVKPKPDQRLVAEIIVWYLEGGYSWVSGGAIAGLRHHARGALVLAKTYRSDLNSVRASPPALRLSGLEERYISGWKREIANACALLHVIRMIQRGESALAAEAARG